VHGGEGGETRTVNWEICTTPGFTVLGWLLPKHNAVPEVYLLLMAMLLGQHISNIPQDVQVSGWVIQTQRRARGLPPLDGHVAGATHQQHPPGRTGEWSYRHNAVLEVYLLLMAMLLGQHISNIPQDVQVSGGVIQTPRRARGL